MPPLKAKSLVVSEPGLEAQSPALNLGSIFFFFLPKSSGAVMKNWECVVSALVMNLTLESQWIKGSFLSQPHASWALFWLQCVGCRGGGSCVLVGIMRKSCPLKSHGWEVTPSLSDEKNPRIDLEARGVAVQEMQSSYRSGIWDRFNASHRPSHGHELCSCQRHWQCSDNQLSDYPLSTRVLLCPLLIAPPTGES